MSATALGSDRRRRPPSADVVATGKSGRLRTPNAGRIAITEIAQVAVAALLALASLGRGSARPAELGQLAWLATFDEDDRAEFFEELRDALSVAASTRDAAPVETCLREWRTTAKAPSDTLRRTILTAPGDDDYAEVDRPQE